MTYQLKNYSFITEQVQLKTLKKSLAHKYFLFSNSNMEAL